MVGNSVTGSTTQKPLKVFSCDHEGRYVFALSLVVAKSRREALKLLKNKLVEMNVATDDHSIHMVEVDITTPQVQILFDGLY